tara:strand:+ start:80 stop:205 length:126 start_codon:yes stop_codon:yes gene_type:complete
MILGRFVIQFDDTYSNALAEKVGKIFKQVNIAVLTRFLDSF